MGRDGSRQLQEKWRPAPILTAEKNQKAREVLKVATKLWVFLKGSTGFLDHDQMIGHLDDLIILDWIFSKFTRCSATPGVSRTASTQVRPTCESMV